MTVLFDPADIAVEPLETNPAVIRAQQICHTTTLVVSRNNSWCGNCGTPALPIAGRFTSCQAAKCRAIWKWCATTYRFTSDLHTEASQLAADPTYAHLLYAGVSFGRDVKSYELRMPYFVQYYKKHAQ